jgi:hypothetical protein
MDMSDDEDDRFYIASTIAIEEDEDAFITSCSPHKSSSAKSPRRGRNRKSAKESWFPLASFIDLKEDDFSSWNWRNFIEVGGAS